MKLKFNLEEIISALDYNDLKGLINMITKDNIGNKYSPTELEELLKTLLCGLRVEEKRRIESLMVSCARFNSLGF